MKIEKISIPMFGFLQATAVVIYIGLVSAFINFSGSLFQTTGQFIGFILFLLLFIFSAVFTASLVLLRSGYLFWEKKYRESFRLLGFTLFWFFVYFTVVVGILVLIKR